MRTHSGAAAVIGCLTPEELETLDHDILFRWFRDFHLHNIYDLEHHVKIGETIDTLGRLPVTFMLLQPPSWMDDVWTDVARMRTLNMPRSLPRARAAPLPDAIRYRRPGN